MKPSSLAYLFLESFLYTLTFLNFSPSEVGLAQTPFGGSAMACRTISQMHSDVVCMTGNADIIELNISADQAAGVRSIQWEFQGAIQRDFERVL